jgi:K(+)-stimulated pyrophosphate-energized sodium pump
MALQLDRGTSAVLAALFFAITLFFVWRSFYGMRIHSGDSPEQAKPRPTDKPKQKIVEQEKEEAEAPAA